MNWMKNGIQPWCDAHCLLTPWICRVLHISVCGPLYSPILVWKHLVWIRSWQRVLFSLPQCGGDHEQMIRASGNLQTSTRSRSGRIRQTWNIFGCHMWAPVVLGQCVCVWRCLCVCVSSWPRGPRAWPQPHLVLRAVARVGRQQVLLRLLAARRHHRVAQGHPGGDGDAREGSRYDHVSQVHLH